MVLLEVVSRTLVRECLFVIMFDKFISKENILTIHGLKSVIQLSDAKMNAFG